MRNTNVRLPESVFDRLEALVAPVSSAPPLELQTLGQISRSDVLRLAILRGLADLEAEFGEQRRLPLGE
ncbi:MAG: hypothetical protein HY855_17810 [Burkholderiales bacterium]|nr:hypothetical protein [Burkholderiales bacterium]